MLVKVSVQIEVIILLPHLNVTELIWPKNPSAV